MEQFTWNRNHQLQKSTQLQIKFLMKTAIRNENAHIDIWLSHKNSTHGKFRRIPCIEIGYLHFAKIKLYEFVSSKDYAKFDVSEQRQRLALLYDAKDSFVEKRKTV